MRFISIGGVELPTPYYYAVSSKDIDSSDSGRSDETGIVHKNRIRHAVKTCDVKWRIPGSALNNLNVCLSDELLQVVLLDPSSAGYVSCDMYAESVRSEFYQQINQNEESSWWDISARLVEY